jgi:hypothetical protein
MRMVHVRRPGHEASKEVSVEPLEIPAAARGSSHTATAQLTAHWARPTHVTSSYTSRPELRSTPHSPKAAHAHVASMAADPTDNDQQAVTAGDAGNGKDQAQHRDARNVEDDDEEEEDDDADEEPKLKYSRLTSSLGPVYRNGDATSSFLVAGDKMV